MNEDTEDDDTTHEMEPPKLLPPVASPDDLPTADVEEGTLCLVADELWTFRSGQWTKAIP